MKKRIIPIIALALIAAIAITTVVFAVCTKNYEPKLNDFSAIKIGQKSTQVTYIDSAKDKESFDELVSLFEESFNESSLNALFNGRFNAGAEVKKSENCFDIDNSSTWILFEYENKDTLPKITYNDTEFSYDRVVLDVKSNSTSAMKTVKLYLLADGDNACSYYFSTNANFYKLFEKINSIIED